MTFRLRHTESATINDAPPATSLGRDSSVASVYNFPALSKSPTWLPQVQYAKPEANRYETYVTTLDNGLRVCLVAGRDVVSIQCYIGCFGETFR